MNHNIEYKGNLNDLSISIAELIKDLSNTITKTNKYFTIALSGGVTPKTLFKLLSLEPYRSELQWNKFQIFQVDERFVPFNHTDNNFSYLNNLLLSKVDIPEHNIHFIHTDKSTPEESANSYEKDIRKIFNIKDKQKCPSFDLIILGVGSDGHTASLFPDDTSINKNSSWVRAVKPPAVPPHVERVTITMPLINNAKNIIFMESEKNKKEIIQNILNEAEEINKKYPASLVQPVGMLKWFIAKGK